MSAEFQFTDRYQALGIPYPETATVCKGQCEGTGWIPINNYETNEQLAALWLDGHRKAHTLRNRVKLFAQILWSRHRFDLGVLTEPCDGWHFVKCPDCNGTGKRAAGAD